MIKGQRVVCINDTFTPSIRALYQQLPVKHDTYTVREVFLGRENRAGRRERDRGAVAG
jgi:hypothetical protein